MSHPQSWQEAIAENLKQFFNALLEQDDGISERCYNMLQSIASLANVEMDYRCIKATDGRFYRAFRCKRCMNLVESISDEDVCAECCKREEFCKANVRDVIRKIYPGAQVDTDNDGQVIIYTGVK